MNEHCSDEEAKRAFQSMELPSFGRSSRHRPPGNSERRWFPLLPRKAIMIQSNQQIRNKWAVLDSISGLVSRWGVFPVSSSSFFLQILQSSGGSPVKRGAYGQRMTKGHSLRNFMELHGTSNTHTQTLSPFHIHLSSYNSKISY